MTYFVIIIVRQILTQAFAQKNTRLKCPGTRNVAHRVPTTADNKGRQAKSLDKVHAVCVTSHTQVKASKTVTRKTVSTTLQDDSLRSVPFHDALDYGLENRLVGEVINSIAKREVDGIVLALSNTNVTKLTSPREVFSVLVERDGHDTVRRVESFLDAIAVVHINVDVQDTLLKTQQLEDTQDNI